MASYDHDWCGCGHPDHPANEKRFEPTTILVKCDGCDEFTHENEVIDDDGSYWCSACWAIIREETKAPELTGAIQ